MTTTTGAFVTLKFPFVFDSILLCFALETPRAPAYLPVSVLYSRSLGEKGNRQSGVGPPRERFLPLRDQFPPSSDPSLTTGNVRRRLLICYPLFSLLESDSDLVEMTIQSRALLRCPREPERNRM
ncbi:uncharacterized protein LOC125501451 [Athalia rosae]|uniref:uncharacterized protein LOC125501451 n=1 Tax=Athalia rosae TaxID=37344 RepID=UPI0020346DBB|nr:uncharacterized protein LOC125501451 [Athalia rosae]